jgi:hypothetical protein
MPEVLAPGTPPWWVDRLSKKLDLQAVEALRYETYYDGDQPLPLALGTEQYRQEFRAMLSAVRDNWMPMVVEAKAQRLNPVGFRFDGLEADAAANEMWQRNHLDADAKLAHGTALTTGRCPVLVWIDAAEQVEITVEHPAQVVVAYSGGNRRRRDAALKRWVDDWTGDTFYTLFLPDMIWKFSRPVKGRRRDLALRADPIENPLGVVPVVEHRHRLRHRDGACRSVLMEVTNTQDVINKTLIDTLVSAEFQAFKQRWATGIDIPKDPVTGKPLMPFKSAVNRVWATADPAAKFGEFAPADLSGFLKLLEYLVQSLASRTATPPHYLIQGQTLPNAESVKAAETGLIASVRDIWTPFGETWEEAIRLGFACQNDPRRDVWNAETIWADPETRSEAEHIDAVLKKRALDVPVQQLWSDAGYTPAQIERFHEMLIAEAAMRDAGGAPDVDAQWAEILKTKAEAMQALLTAGATPASAAEAAGLADVQFVAASAAPAQPALSG